MNAEGKGNLLTHNVTKSSSRHFIEFKDSVFNNIKNFLDSDSSSMHYKQITIEKFLQEEFNEYSQNKTTHKVLGIDTSKFSKEFYKILLIDFKKEFHIYWNKYLDSYKPNKTKNKKDNNY